MCPTDKKTKLGISGVTSTVACAKVLFEVKKPKRDLSRRCWQLLAHNLGSFAFAVTVQKVWKSLRGRLGETPH